MRYAEAVAGIVPDVHCDDGANMVFASFGRNAGEPVKIWDARRMDSTLGEITVPRCRGGGVSAVAWSVARPGVLSIAVGNSIRDYDTRSPGSRAFPVGVSYMDTEADGGEGAADDSFPSSFVQCLAFQPQVYRDEKQPISVQVPGDPASPKAPVSRNPFEFYPHRTMAVSSQGQIKVIPESHAAPLAVSKRDGRVATGLGGTVWIGSTTDGMCLQ